jgi:hypothetical protein
VQAVLPTRGWRPAALVEPCCSTCPDPRQKVLEDALPQIGAVRVDITDPV